MERREIIELIENTIYEYSFSLEGVTIHALKGALWLECEICDKKYKAEDIIELLPELNRYQPKEEHWDVNEDLCDRVKNNAYLYVVLIGIEKEEEILGELSLKALLDDDDAVAEEGFNRMFWYLYPKVASICVKYMPYEWMDIFCHSIKAWKYSEDFWEDVYTIEVLYFLIGFLYMMGDYAKEVDQNEDNADTSKSDIHLQQIPLHLTIPKPEISSRELANREKRLRRAAAKKGFRIEKLRKKRNSQNDLDSAYAYAIDFGEVDGNGAGMRVHSIEEAEEVVLGSNS